MIGIKRCVLWRNTETGTIIIQDENNDPNEEKISVVVYKGFIATHKTEWEKVGDFFYDTNNK